MKTLNRGEKKSFFSGWKGFVLAMLLAGVVRSFAFEPYHIPSSSMVPSLLVGDYLFISKYDYGFSKHSFPFSLPLIPTGRIFETIPKQGDVVIFKNVREGKDYIKRVIGLPGDKIQVKDGRLYINDVMLPREKQGIEKADELGDNRFYTRYIETLPNGVQHPIYEIGDNLNFDKTEAIIVPQNHFFAMGDNRDNSLDSRYFGTFDFETLEGKARFIFYSNRDPKSWFFQFYKWGDILRFNRFFSSIR